MPRFAQPPDPDFRRLNDSISFDRRLWPYDVAQSRAHVGMLAAQEIISAADRDALIAALGQVEQELRNDSFPFDQGDEDIHMAIERRVTELAGEAGGRLHTARSRNDQVATDMAMYVRDRGANGVELVTALIGQLVALAESHLDWPMPGYTHLQRAQPVYLSHHLLAYAWMFLRDGHRFAGASQAANVLPLGAGALAGVNFDTDRQLVADELGFAAMAENSIDAVSNRDFVLDYLAAASACATHLSRLGAELVLWSSEEFGFCELSDAWTSGSSIMPQKKNPDAAELLRAKAPRVVSHLSGLHGVMHGLPLTYNKDMQEDKEHVFDAADTIELSLAAARGMLEAISFRRDRLEAAAADEFLAATDVADLLVRRGLPFRQAHGVVGGLVRTALEQGKSLSELTPGELAEASPLLDDEFYELLRGDTWLESKRSRGGTGLKRVREQLHRVRQAVSALQASVKPAFYDRPVLEVARDLVGCVVDHGPCSGVIVETEAYHESEPASHAFVGLTPRTATLFGPPGRAYVYRSYGVHAMLNAVCEPVGVGAGVLIRALEPVEGIELMRERRGLDNLRGLCSGPGKLTQAMEIELSDNGVDLARGAVTISRRPASWRDVAIAVDRRIGINKAVELPWRFCAADSRFLSRAVRRERPGRDGSGKTGAAAAHAAAT